MMNFNIIDKSLCCIPNNDIDHLPVAIIGAGPIGLAAAAHLAERGEPFILVESGEKVGSNIRQWGHVRLFSPWQYNIDKIARKLLEHNNWIAPPAEELPNGKELVELYLEPLSELPQIQPHILFNSIVTAVSKKGLDKMKTEDRENASFAIYLEQDGTTSRIEAKAVIDASGTWSHPNPINTDNVWTLEEKVLQDHIYYGIPNTATIRGKYSDKRVAVIGGGHSAINTILELTESGSQELYWIMRKKKVEDAYGGEEKDALEARGELGSRIHHLVDNGTVKPITPFYIQQLKDAPTGIQIIGQLNGKPFELEVDEIIANTGSRPDFSFLREIRLSVDVGTESVEALSTLIDPNLHSCGTVRPHGEEILRQPEKNFYVVGMKSYGRAPTFLMATGYEQVRSVVAYLTGDLTASKAIELDLPETGVCSTDIKASQAGSSCCGGC